MIGYVSVAVNSVPFRIVLAGLEIGISHAMNHRYHPFMDQSFRNPACFSHLQEHAGNEQRLMMVLLPQYERQKLWLIILECKESKTK